MRHHVMRYAWATQFVAGKRVVDLGCGTGYGSFMLSWMANGVLGVDLSKEAIEFANMHFHTYGLAFERFDITKLIPDADLYVAFEVLEHLDSPHLVLAGIKAPLVWSIPVESESRFHKRTYSIERIRRMIPGQYAYQTHRGAIITKLTNTNIAQIGYVLGYKPGGAYQMNWDESTHEKRCEYLAQFDNELRSIIAVLLENEQYLSDGYEHYASFSIEGNRGKEQAISTLAAIAREILKAARKGLGE